VLVRSVVNNTAIPDFVLHEPSHLTIAIRRHHIIPYHHASRKSLRPSTTEPYHYYLEVADITLASSHRE
jgi:hypothetical protein